MVSYFKFFVLLCYLTTGSSVLRKNDVEILHLIGEPDFRSVSLHWEAPIPEDETISPEFMVNYCELQAWGPHRCQSKMVDDKDVHENIPSEDPSDSTRIERSRTYSMRVGGLRMATSYSFTVKPTKSRRSDRSEGDGENSIIVPTKGFSARATKCLPHASEIEVSTGPFFAGRITVESNKSGNNAANPACSIDGRPDSSQNVYTLRIDHALCGSDVNASTVATFVIVQENLPILTHSTRRFLVLCTYQPEVLTVRAGFSLPASSRKGQVEVVAARRQGARSLLNRPLLIMKADYDELDAINRVHAIPGVEPAVPNPAKLVDQRHGVEEIIQVKEIQENSSVPVILMLLTISGLVGGVAALIFRLKKSQKSDIDSLDTVSISSTISCRTDYPQENEEKNNSIQFNSISVPEVSGQYEHPEDINNILENEVREIENQNVIEFVLKETSVSLDASEA